MSFKIPLKKLNLIIKLSSLLYEFLPGSGAPYTFADAAQGVGVGNFWIGGNKLPAIQKLLEQTYLWSKECFSSLILTIVRHAIKYRDIKGMPLTCQEIIELNDMLIELGTPIMELADSDFLETLEIAKPQNSVSKGEYLKLYDSLMLKPKIIEVSRDLYADGHYAQAIFEAFKAVNNYVKAKLGKSDMDGQSLMAHVFNEKKPIIRLNPLKTQSDKDEQMGFKFIYMGSMTGIRNPKAHDQIKQKDPIRTLKYLALASLLIERAEEGKVNV